MPGPRWQEDPLAASMHPPTPLTPLTPEYWAEESAPLAAAMRDEPVSDVTLFGAGQTALAATSIVDPTMASDVASAALYKLEGDDEAAAIAIAAGLAGLGAGALAAKLWKMRQAHKAAMKAKGLSDEAAEAAAAETAEQAEKLVRSPRRGGGIFAASEPDIFEFFAVRRQHGPGQRSTDALEKARRRWDELKSQKLIDDNRSFEEYADDLLANTGTGRSVGDLPSQAALEAEARQIAKQDPLLNQDPQERLVSEWIDSPPGTPPPEGLDPELIESTRRLYEGFGGRIPGGPTWTPESERRYIMEQINKMDLLPTTKQGFRERMREMALQPGELQRARKRLRSKQSSMREEEQDFLFGARSDPEDELLARGMRSPALQRKEWLDDVAGEYQGFIDPQTRTYLEGATRFKGGPDPVEFFDTLDDATLRQMGEFAKQGKHIEGHKLFASKYKERYGDYPFTDDAELFARGMTRPGSQYLHGTGTYSPPTVARRPGPTRADWPGPATEASEQANERARRLGLVDRRQYLRDYGLSEEEAIEAAGELGGAGPFPTMERGGSRITSSAYESTPTTLRVMEDPERYWRSERDKAVERLRAHRARGAAGDPDVELDLMGDVDEIDEALWELDPTRPYPTGFTD